MFSESQTSPLCICLDVLRSLFRVHAPDSNLPTLPLFSFVHSFVNTSPNSAF